MEGSETAADRLVLKRLRNRQLVWMTDLVPFGLLWWVACHWAIRRLDVDEGTAYFGTTLFLLARGGLIAVAGARAAKAMGWKPAANPALTPHVRWLQAERAARISGKSRVCLIFLISVTTLQKSAAFMTADSHALSDSGWFFISYLGLGAEFYWPFFNRWADELTRARQRQAARVGYSAMTLLGLPAAVYIFYHPGFAAPALPVILLLGLLACLVRMAWLERRPLPAEPHGPSPANGVREARTRQGLSYAALAERVGVPSRMVEAVECGRHEASAHLALRFADALGTSVEALFAG